MDLGADLHIALDRFPDEKNLPTAERSEVVDTLDQDTVFQAFSDRSDVVLDTGDSSSVVKYVWLGIGSSFKIVFASDANISHLPEIVGAYGRIFKSFAIFFYLQSHFCLMIRFKLGEMIEKRQFAEGRRISINEIAAATDLNRMTLSKILNQKGYGTGTDTIDRLCRFFNCRVEDLIEYVPDEP